MDEEFCIVHSFFERSMAAPKLGQNELGIEDSMVVIAITCIKLCTGAARAEPQCDGLGIIRASTQWPRSANHDARRAMHIVLPAPYTPRTRSSDFCVVKESNTANNHDQKVIVLSAL